MSINISSLEDDLRRLKIRKEKLESELPQKTEPPKPSTPITASEPSRTASKNLSLSSEPSKESPQKETSSRIHSSSTRPDSNVNSNITISSPSRPESNLSSNLTISSPSKSQAPVVQADLESICAGLEKGKFKNVIVMVGAGISVAAGTPVSV